jgi:hypothetical protein
MKAPTKTAIAMFSGTAALAMTVGFGGIGVSQVGASTTWTRPSSVTMARAGAAAPASHTGVHPATLTGCISGANC